MVSKSFRRTGWHGATARGVLVVCRPGPRAAGHGSKPGYRWHGFLPSCSQWQSAGLSPGPQGVPRKRTPPMPAARASVAVALVARMPVPPAPQPLWVGVRAPWLSALGANPWMGQPGTPACPVSGVARCSAGVVEEAPLVLGQLQPRPPPPAVASGEAGIAAYATAASTLEVVEDTRVRCLVPTVSVREMPRRLAPQSVRPRMFGAPHVIAFLWRARNRVRVPQAAFALTVV